MRRLIVYAGIGAPLGYYYLFERKTPIEVEGEEYKKGSKPPYSYNPNQHIFSKYPSKIGIIGAGVSGLATAKTLKQEGYEVEILEKNPDIGGVWYENYEDVGLQSPYIFFQFPDFDFPVDATIWATLPEVKSYLKSYSSHFNITNAIQFNKKVSQIQQKPDETWSVKLEDGSSKDYDFLVLCSGMFYKPYLPTFKDAESFKGKIVHSSEVSDSKSLFEDKNVIVIGGQKSAWDHIEKSGIYAKRTTSVMRNVSIHLSPKDTYLGFIQVGAVLRSRFTSLFRPSLDYSASIIHDYFYPLVMLYFYLLSRYDIHLPKELRCTYDLKHYHPLRFMTRSEQVVDLVKTGKVVVVKGSIERLTEDRAIINGESYPADVIVCATGFDINLYGLEGKTGDVWMYRNTIVPGLRNLAVIGVCATTNSSLYSNLQAVWLAEALRGAFSIPDVNHMEKEVVHRKKVFEGIFGDFKTLPYSWVTCSLVDQLLTDMGMQTNRGKSFIGHWYGHTLPKDYKAVLTHRV